MQVPQTSFDPIPPSQFTPLHRFSQLNQFPLVDVNLDRSPFPPLVSCTTPHHLILPVCRFWSTAVAWWSSQDPHHQTSSIGSPPWRCRVAARPLLLVSHTTSLPYPPPSPDHLGAPTRSTFPSATSTHCALVPMTLSGHHALVPGASHWAQARGSTVSALPLAVPNHGRMRTPARVLAMP
jgi:hypothetical protein